MKLILRIQLIIWGIITAFTALFAFFNYQSQKTDLLNEIDKRLETGATMARAIVGEDYHNNISDQYSVSKEQYSDTVASFNKLSSTNGFKYLWSNLFLADGRIVFTTATSSSHELSQGSYAAFYDVHTDPNAFKQVINTGKPSFSTFQNKWGTGRMVLIPYKDSHNRTYVFGSSISLSELENEIQSGLIRTFIIFTLFWGISLALVNLLSRTIINPINKNTQATSDISQGNYKVNIDSNFSCKELNILAENINEMSSSILENYNELDAIIESLPLMIFIKDAKDLNFVKFNKAGEVLLGISRNEMIGKNDYDLFPKEQADFFTNKDRKVIESGTMLDIAEEPIETASGRKILHTRKVAINDNNGKPAFLLGISEDITERKQIERRLKNNEKNLAEAQQIAHIGNWWLNFKTGELYWSDEIYRIFGRQPHEFEPSYERFFETVHPDDVNKIKQSEEKAFAHKKLHSIDHRIILPDGEVRWVHEEAVPTFDDSGEMIFLSGTVQDITLRKQLENDLIKSEDRLRGILENITDWVWEIDMEGNFTYASSEVEKILGYKPEELLNMNAFELMTEEEAKRVDKEYSQFIEKQMPFKDMLNINRHKNGTRVTTLSSGIPVFNPSGEMVGYRGTDKDVTAKVQMEKQLQVFKTFTDSSQQSMGWATIGGQIEYANTALVNLLEASDITDVIGKNIIHDFYPNSYRKKLEDTIFPIILKEGFWYGELILKTTTGKLINTLNSLSLITDERDKPLYITNVVTDITEIKEQENVLKQHQNLLKQTVKEKTKEIVLAKENAERANKFKSEFLSNMSHELRTPMHGIISYANMGISRIESADNNKKLKYFTNIKNSAARLMLLVNDLLDLSKLEAGKMEMDFTICNLKSISENSVLEQKARLDENAQTVVYLTDDFDDEGQFDELRISQVITNLLSNAIKFAPEGKNIEISISHITIDLSNTEQNIPAYLYSIRDYGKGIANEELEIIFNPFEQGKDSVLGTTKSTGLGLPICKEIIELHHGKIWAENHSDGGAVFSFIIPVEQPTMDKYRLFDE